MFNVFRKEIEWGGKKLVLETGHMARQAHGTVQVTYGETSVICSVCAAKEANPDADFFPLTVIYQEKAYAAGKIPGGFFKREGRPSERETLISRMVDRPIRPLFPDGFKNETQVVCTLLSHDLENDPDVVAMVAASAALTISGVPFMGPIAGSRIGYIDGEYVLNPTLEETTKSDLELMVAGTKEGVLMVESEAKELSEEVMLGAVTFGHEQMQPVIDLIISLAEECAKEPWDLPEKPAEYGVVTEKFEAVRPDLEKAFSIAEKMERQDAIKAAKEKAVDLLGEDEDLLKHADSVFKNLESDIVRGAILKTGKRIDGRDTKTVRQLDVQVGILPRAHGSALFTRGETQALVVSTLGTGQDEQVIDDLTGEYRSKFMLHYNFPPYSVGEARRMGPPGRREIGHGKLAWRAINPMLNLDEDSFPYTVRAVSEIMESNGSSSMATVCGTSLALMDAGVPMDRPVAGIAMGLIKEGDDFAVLTDILGDEDHLGDMDFKVAGTSKGITALQMDIKITSITKDIMKVALDQAHEGRIHILDYMSSVIGGSREEVNSNAPRITTIQIAKDKIREVIGTGGKIIREITETTGTRIDISDEGLVKIAALTEEAAKSAVDWVIGIVAEPEVDVIYDGKVVKCVDFGAFVNFLGGKDGLVHISELAPERIGKVTDVVKEGDEVKVKVIGIDNRGKVKLSMKRVNQETGQDISDQFTNSRSSEKENRKSDN